MEGAGTRGGEIFWRRQATFPEMLLGLEDPGKFSCLIALKKGGGFGPEKKFYTSGLPQNCGNSAAFLTSVGFETLR